MSISPIFESQADEKTKKIYQQLKQAFGVSKPPIFFCYLAPFYEYFSYITDQIIANLNNEKFIEIINETKDIIFKLIKDNFKKSNETNEFLNRFKYSPQFFYFQKNLEKIFDTNLKLTFIFIALREAVKGWAIAAKKIGAKTESSGFSSKPKIDEEELIFNLNEVVDLNEQTKTKQKDIQSFSNAIINAPFSGIEKDLLPAYLQLCRNDFYFLMKKEEYVFIRLEIEKIILRFLNLLPELIISPVNLVIEMTKKYEDYPDLLYLLSEHFPTTVVQRLMFSGYMREEKSA
jgi:hypothetical protein